MTTEEKVELIKKAEGLLKEAEDCVGQIFDDELQNESTKFVLSSFHIHLLDLRCDLDSFYDEIE